MLFPPRHGRALPWVALGLLGWLASTVLLAAPASAHAALQSTDPEDGEVLDATPETITLTFNEPVSPVDESTSLLDAEGSPVEVDVTASGPDVILAPDEDLSDGSYIVNWRVISADDHPITGSFIFSVGEPSESVIDLSAAGGSDRYLELALRSADAVRYATLLGASGLLFFAAVAVPRQAWRQRSVESRFTRVVRISVIGLAISSIAVLPLDALWSRGAGLGGLLDVAGWSGSVSSSRLLASALGLAGVLIAWACWRRALLAPMIVALVVGAGAPAVTGHPRTYGQAYVTALADIVHLAAAAVWVGGIAGLILILSTLRPAEASIAARTVARFSSVALISVAVLALAGLVLVWQIPGFSLQWPELLYDRLLAAKVAIVLVAVCAAAWNRFVLVPRLDQAATRSDALVRLRRVLVIEAVALVVVLAITATLVAQVPRDASIEQTPSQTVSEVFDGGEVDVVVTPGTLGVNALEITLTDADGEPLEPEEDPRLALLLEEFGIGPLEESLTPTGPGRYTATIDVQLEGTWTIELAIRVDRFAEPVVRMEVDLS